MDRPGELVTREELRQRLWSAETFVDFEHGLNAAVRRLRDALGDALEFAGRARDLDPVSPNARQNLGLVHYFGRRYDDAITQFREALDLDPNFGQAHVMLGRIYVAKGLPDRAIGELELAKSLMGARPDVLTPMAYVLARAGRRREALAMLDELQRMAKPRDPSPYRLAYVHLALGETDVAFDWLEKSLVARDWQLAMLKVEPAFDGPRSDPRFAVPARARRPRTMTAACLKRARRGDTR